METSKKGVSTPRLILAAELLAMGVLGSVAIFATHNHTICVWLFPVVLFLGLASASKELRDGLIKYWWAAGLFLVPLGFTVWKQDIRPHPYVVLSREYDGCLVAMFLVVVLTQAWIWRSERNET